jgi:phosphoglycerol transferase
VAAVGATLLLMAAALRLWRADPGVPLFYAADNLMNQMFVQNILETGWFLDSPRLGAPGTLDLRDFPMADVLHFGIIKLFGCVWRDAGLILNLYYLLSFPLTALSTYFVLRRLGLGRLACLPPSVLFACTPYHFLRMQGHVFLSAYYLIPLMVGIILRVLMGQPRRRFVRREAAGAALVCVLTGLAGVYYAFFSCFLLLAAGLAAALRQRRWASLGWSALLSLLIAASLGAALAPSILHVAHRGKNPEVADRSPAEAETYALNVFEMLLPVQGHRVAALDRFQERFQAPRNRPAGAPVFTTLGLFGSLGFLYLVGRFLWRRRPESDRIEDGLAYLSVVAVMLGTAGGLGTAFAFCASPLIRAYDRISIFLAFFALAGLAFALQRFANRHLKSRWGVAAYAAGQAGLLLLGALDQTSDRFVPDHAEMQRAYTSDWGFARRLEQVLPPGALVYQMPYVPFPESPPSGKLDYYDLLRPFLHSRTLRWSYAAMKGREGDRWHAAVAALPVGELLEQLAVAGFRGVCVDRDGYADRGRVVERQLARLLGVRPLISGNGRHSFFDLTEYVGTLRGRCTEAEWDSLREEIFHPVGLRWGESFCGPEQEPFEGTWRWCGARGELRITNPLPRRRCVILSMECSTWHAAPARLVVDGDLGHRELSIDLRRRPLELRLAVPPGEHVLSFSCDGPRMAGVRRELVFRVWEVACRTAPPAQAVVARPEKAKPVASLYHHGVASFLRGDERAAGRALTQVALLGDPASAGHARYLLARLYHADARNNQRREAMRLYWSALEVSAKTPPEYVARAHFFLGVLLYEDGAFAKALTHLTKFLQQRPGSPLAAEAQLRQGLCRLELKQFSEAEKTLRLLAKREPRLADQALLGVGKARVGAASLSDPEGRAQALEHAQEAFREAAKHARRLAGSDSEARARRGEALLELADAQQRAGKHRAAVGTYNQVLREKLLPGRDEEVLQALAAALHLAGEYPASDEVCARFRASYPASPLLSGVLFRYAENAYCRADPAHQNRDTVRWQDETIRRCREVVEKYPESANVEVARYRLGLTYYQKGDLKKAREFLEAIPVGARIGELAAVPYWLADCLVRLAPVRADDAVAAGMLVEALRSAAVLLNDFAGAQPKSPRMPDALIELGYCRQRLAAIFAQPADKAQELAAGRATYEHLLKNYPGSERVPQAIFERAKCLALQKDIGGAMDELRRFSAAGDLKDTAVAPMALLELATLLRRQGEPAQAADELARCRRKWEATLQADPSRAGWVPLLRDHHGLALRAAGKPREARKCLEGRKSGGRP